MKKKCFDERIHSETNRHFSKAFTILSLLILIDIVIKLSMWELTEGLGLGFFITVGLETIILLVSFLTTTIFLARKGIAFGAVDYIEEKFPKKRYFKISLVVGFVFGIWTVFRMIYFGRSPNYLIYDILFGVGFYIVVWFLAGLIMYIYFYLIFNLAKKYYNKTFE